MSFSHNPKVTRSSTAKSQPLQAGKTPLRFKPREGAYRGGRPVFSMETQPKTRGALVRNPNFGLSPQGPKPINFAGLGMRRPMMGKDLFSSAPKASTKQSTAIRGSRAPEGPTLIGPYDTINSFVSTKSVEANKEAIRRVCGSNMNIVVTFESSCNGKGQMVSNHEMCDFAISMMRFDQSHPEHAGKLLVEFQRRNGSSFVFAEFISFVVGNLKRDTEVVHFTRVCENSFVRSLPPPIDDLSDLEFSDDDFDLEEEEASCANDLVEMLCDGYAECRRHAATVLARKTEEDNFKSTLVSAAPKLLDQLAKAIETCNDCQVVRGVSVVLCNLFQDSSLCKRAQDASSLIANLQNQFQKWSPNKKSHVQSRIEPSIHVASQLERTLRLLQCEA